MSTGEIKLKNKLYYEKHKDRIKQARDKYYNLHSDRILHHNKIKVHCVECDKTVVRIYYKKHLLTKPHIDNLLKSFGYIV